MKGATAQSDLSSIEEYAKRFGGVELSDRRIVFVQVVFYSPSLKAPTLAEIKSWAEHYKMDRSKSRIVLAGESQFINNDTYNLIPGFQLIDASFVLRSDSSGHNPKNNLYSELLPLLGKLVKETP